MGLENTKFLVVDDFSTMRRIVRNLLKELGFGHSPVVFGLHIGIGLEVEAVGEVVADGVARRLLFLLAQHHPRLGST